MVAMPDKRDRRPTLICAMDTRVSDWLLEIGTLSIQH